ncbi:hypothetical protein ACP275_13G024700 [Erythranthe tilingii]
MEALQLQFLYLLPPLFLTLYTVTHHFLNKFLNLPPTPFPILPILGHLHFFFFSITKSTLPLHRSLSQISRRRGPILLLRLGSRPVLLVSSPSAAQECLVENDVVFADRPNLLNGKHFGYNFTSLAWAPYGGHWRNLRRISTLELLSARRVDALAGVRADASRALVQKLVAIGGGGGDVDLRRLFFEHVYNAVMRMITGEEEAAAAEGWEVFGGIVAEMTAVTLEANVVDFVPLVGRLFGIGDCVERKMSFVQEKRERFMENVIEKHRAKKKEDEDVKEKSLIQFLLDLQREEPEYYTDQTIRNLLLVLLQGATHATSTTLEWAFSHLLQNPHILTRARFHIDSHLVGKERHLITESEVVQIPYLHLIINETLRMHPPAPLLTPHLSSQECTVGGFCVPRGTMLLVNAWDIHNNPETWENPNEFLPERFEGVGKNKYGFDFLPFGWGRRGCPGEKLAVVMIGAVLGCLIQCFEWERVGGGEIDMREGKGVITTRVQPLRAKCCPRSFLVDDSSFLK